MRGIVFLLMALLGCTFAFPHTNVFAVEKPVDTPVSRFFDQLLAMAPFDDVLGEVLESLSEDEEVQEAIEYLESAEYQQQAVKVQNSKEFIAFMEFFYKYGLDVYYYLNRLGEYLGIPPMVRPTTPKYDLEVRSTGGLNGLLDRIIALLPLDDMDKFYQDQLKVNKDLKAMIDAIGSEEFRAIGRACQSLDTYKVLVQRLKNHHVDVDAMLEKLARFFGWS